MTTDDTTYVSKVIGDMDPGYGSTKMLAESAVFSDKTPEIYGVPTPSTALGDPLKRLEEKLATFKINF